MSSIVYLARNKFQKSNFRFSIWNLFLISDVTYHFNCVLLFKIQNKVVFCFQDLGWKRRQVGRRKSYCCPPPSCGVVRQIRDLSEGIFLQSCGLTNVWLGWNIYYNNIWDSVQRCYIPNFIFIALILTKLLAEIVFREPTLHTKFQCPSIKTDRFFLLPARLCEGVRCHLWANQHVNCWVKITPTGLEGKPMFQNTTKKKSP